MYSEETSFPVAWKRVQFPVLLAYYLTIARVQGQTLEHIGIDLPQSVFGHGQLYTAESRCGDPNNISVYANQMEFEGIAHELKEGVAYTRNVVYNEVFHLANRK